MYICQESAGYAALSRHALEAARAEVDLARLNGLKAGQGKQKRCNEGPEGAGPLCEIITKLQLS